MYLLLFLQRILLLLLLLLLLLRFNFFDSLPRIIEFTNLDQPKELKAAKKALKGLAGVYAIINNITGAVYIGSSMNPRAVYPQEDR